MLNILLKLFLNDIKNGMTEILKASMDQEIENRKEFICTSIQAKKRWPGEVRRHLEKLIRQVPDELFSGYSLITSNPLVSFMFKI